VDEFEDVPLNEDGCLAEEFDQLKRENMRLEVSLWFESNPFHTTLIGFIKNTNPSVLCIFCVRGGQQKK
jgi:cell shape-determining protein MreC